MCGKNSALPICPQNIGWGPASSKQALQTWTRSKSSRPTSHQRADPVTSPHPGIQKLAESVRNRSAPITHLHSNLSQGSFLTARLSLNRFQSSHEVSHPAWPPQRIKFSLRAIMLKLNRSGVKVLSGKEIGQGMVQSRATRLWKALGPQRRTTLASRAAQPIYRVILLY